MSDLHSCHKGATSELIACAWLLSLGYEVFRNVSGGGPADIVAWKAATGEKHVIDVKTTNVVRYSHDGRRVVTYGAPERRDQPAEVRLLFVSQGEVIGFYRRRTTKCPNGDLGNERYWPLSGPDLFIDAP